MPNEMTFAGVEFTLDHGIAVRTGMKAPASKQEDEEQSPIRKYQPDAQIVEELDRLIPFDYAEEFLKSPGYPGRNLGALAHPWQFGMQGLKVRIGEWFYPHGACRFSVFRGLASTDQASRMLAQTGGVRPGSFHVNCKPFTGCPGASYDVETPMYMLPPRPLVEYSEQFDGLWMVTLVDKRYYWARQPATLAVFTATDWSDLISELADALAVDIQTLSTIEDEWWKPEQDSHLWANKESAAVLLDAVARNVGRTVVRGYDGVYTLMTAQESYARSQANRALLTGKATTAGGNIFNRVSGSASQLSGIGGGVGRNAVVPGYIQVTFPWYVAGDDPVPHFLNDRYADSQRPSAWYEQSYGDVYTAVVPITAAGPQASQVYPLASGLPPAIGSGSVCFHETAKALILTEAGAGGTPLNVSGVHSLAYRVAKDYYDRQSLAAMDECFDGTVKIELEGTHDIVWTWSAKARQAMTRIVRSDWNRFEWERQHGTPPVVVASGQVSDYFMQTKNPIGVGGPSVAQTWRDSLSCSGWNAIGSGSSADSAPSYALAEPLLSGGDTARLRNNSFLPTDGNWRGLVGNEAILFSPPGQLQSGASGLSAAVSIVARGIDGSLQAPHAIGDQVQMLVPNVNYGTNLVTFREGQFLLPSDWTNGGIQGVDVIPQMQTVRVLATSGVVQSGIMYYPATVQQFNPAPVTSGNPFNTKALVWAVDRNNSGPTIANYEGLFGGYSAQVSGAVRPVYTISTGAATGGGGGGATSGCQTVVTNVCIDWGAEEVTVEYTNCATGEKTCVVNPTNCCEPPPPVICCDDAVPSVLRCTFTAGISCLDGLAFDMTFDGSGPMGDGWYSETITWFVDTGANEFKLFLECTPGGVWNLYICEGCACDIAICWDPDCVTCFTCVPPGLDLAPSVTCDPFFFDLFLDAGYFDCGDNECDGLQPDAWGMMFIGITEP